jgi:nucleotide-binding universal stress UspA family protein
MISIERILSPVDLAHDAGGALGYAAALAQTFGAKLFAYYCAGESLPERTLARHEKCAGLKSDIERSFAAQDGHARLQSFELESVVGEGRDAAEAIAREAAARRVDLIVMNSRRRPVAAALLGSTAERVCRMAPCPVLVTHPEERERVDAAGRIDLRRILVAYDFSNDSELALRHGLSLAQEYETELHLLHVMRRPERDGPEVACGPDVMEGAYHAALRRLQKAVPEEAGLPRAVTTAVHWGKPYREILSYAREQDADLICMGASGAEFGMGTLFGSNADRVLRQAPCPVLVTRPLKPAAFSPSHAQG